MFIAMDLPVGTTPSAAVVSPIVAPDNLAKLEGLIRERRRQDLRQPAAQRSLQLGRPRLDRADDADAGDAVRLPLGRAAQADPLVGRGDGRGPQAFIGPRKPASPSCSSAPTISPSCGTSASTTRTARRPDLDAGARRVDPDMDRMEFLGNLLLLIVGGGNDTTRNSAHRRPYALSKNPEQGQAQRPNPSSSRTRCLRSSAGRPRSPTCGRTAVEDAIPGGSRSRRATRSSCGTSRQPRREVIPDADKFIIDRKNASPPLVRLRHPSLRRQPSRRCSCASSGRPS